MAEAKANITVARDMTTSPVMIACLRPILVKKDPMKGALREKLSW